jgi:hypothetical protein
MTSFGGSAAGHSKEKRQAHFLLNFEKSVKINKMLLDLFQGCCYK